MISKSDPSKVVTMPMLSPEELKARKDYSKDLAKGHYNPEAEKIKPLTAPPVAANLAAIHDSLITSLARNADLVANMFREGRDYKLDALAFLKETAAVWKILATQTGTAPKDLTDEELERIGRE
jgi:3-hydroxyacyl-CoA dehydrogenase